MSNGWTGGQYSIFRIIFGAYLTLRFARLIPWGEELFSNRGVLPDTTASPLTKVFPNILAVCDSPAFVSAFLFLAVGLSICLALGIADRAAAVILWYLSACLFGRNPLISNPSLPFVGWMLLAHACQTPAPFGSWRARRRIDPDGGWHYSRWIFAGAWIVLSLGYAYGGITKLISPSWINGNALHHVLCNPLARPTFLRETLLSLPSWILTGCTWAALALELAFAPLALSRRLRPMVWLLMLAMHIGLLFLIDFAELSMGMILMHFFTFDPAWVRRLSPEITETIFYDGHCGVCHGFVRFVIAEDHGIKPAFQFAPLNGDTFNSEIPASRRVGLPESIILMHLNGSLLSRSAAALQILARLGGLWRVFGWVIAIVPRPVRDRAYDMFARIRHKLITRPLEACPLLPHALQARFLP